MMEKDLLIKAILFQINSMENLIDELSGRIKYSLMNLYEFEDCIQQRLECLKNRRLLIEQLNHAASSIAPRTITKIP